MKKTIVTWCLGFGIFILLLTILTVCTTSDESQKGSDNKIQLPFSMYDWKYGTMNDAKKVADVCGKDSADNNVSLHISKIDFISYVYVMPDPNYLRWRPGEEYISYSVRFSPINGDYSHSSSCRCLTNENGNVLYVEHSKKIMKLLQVNTEFVMEILKFGKVVNTYKFKVRETLDANKL